MGRSSFTSFISVLAVGVVTVAAIYFFFPDLSQELLGTKWEREEYALTAEDSGEAAEEVTQDIEQAFEESGADRQDIEEVLSQIDPETLTQAASEALISGEEAAKVFIEKLDESIDLGGLDRQVLEEKLQESFEGIDFSQAAELLREYAERGFENLEQAAGDMVQ
ncbi:MAG: hypothetical protein ACQEQU_04700 [Spirochaetota bacterium]